MQHFARLIALLLTVGLFVLIVVTLFQGTQRKLPPDVVAQGKAGVGRAMFFDANLSEPRGQSCASCHSPTHGFADPRGLATSEGAVTGRFSQRNAPTISYAMFSPERFFDEKEGHYVGGQFYDGRAQTLEEQALEPLLSPIEMNNPDKAAIVAKVKEAKYAKQLQQLYGDDVFSTEEKAIAAITNALATFQRSKEVNPFSSKYDAYLMGKVDLTDEEKRGLALFEDEKKGNCAACHPSQVANGKLPLFTDFTYDNLGLGINLKSPFLTMGKAHNPAGKTAIDLGLGKIVNSTSENGKFKVPTLRNVALTPPYMHNGLLTSMHQTIEFYNSRDIPGKWSAPEVADNVNTEELGNLGLTEDEVHAIEAFMKTLSDGYQLPAVNK